MDARLPAVVAVVVTHDPGPWFEETLAAWAAQPYEELSVLVLDAGGEEDPSARVSAALPDAFVRRFPGPCGFPATANEVLGMVEGAAFFLLCHDDCAPEPGAVHLLVEESFRSNAGVVSPKMLRWDDPSVLLHVGMNADKTGAVVERVQEGEVDHGQHDGVRDVFVAPGGCTLVRADLFAELGGFDPGLVALGEDLDLSWRAQILGSRVVVAPEARVRHLQVVAGGLRAPPVSGGGPPPTLQALQRRHELRAVLKCYSLFHLLRVLPQALLLAAGELVVALFAGNRERGAAVAGAWWWNLRRLGELRRLRRAVRAQRNVPDSAVRRLQLHGSARLSTYLSRLTHQGFDVAQGRAPSSESRASGDEEPLLTGSVGLAFSEDADFDELDDLGHRSGRERSGRQRSGRRRTGVLTTHRSRVIVSVVAALVLVVGTRSLLSGGFPLIGQLGPLLGWSATWHQFVTGWQATGVGSTAPTTPAFALLGGVGTVLLGGMGLVQKILVLGCIPLGAWGMSRLLAPLMSARARLVGTICYLGLPLAYDALARGRWDGLVAYAALPWIVLRLARATGLAPFDADPGNPTGWRATLLGQIVALGVVEALAAAFAPAVAPVVLLCGLAMVVGSMVIGEWEGSLRALGVAAGATAVAALLCAPWVVGILASGHSAVGVFGLPPSPGSAPGWGALLRFATGPIGGSPLSWLPVAAALLPLLIGQRQRLAWATRFWVLACAGWVLALAVGHGWTGAFAPTLDVVLVPAAVGVAAAVGLGVAAFETDLSGYRFGWRQLVTALAVGAAVVGLLPVVAESVDGRWGLPATGDAQPLAFLSATASSGPFRVLWLGQPDALPLGGWSADRGLAYATSEDGAPDARYLWAPAGPGPAVRLGRAVELARAGETSHLGRLLAPAGVRYVVVLSTLAPVIPGTQQPPALPVPADLLPALTSQDDLRVVPGEEGLTVFENTESLPIRAARPGPPSTSASWPRRQDLVGWKPVLPGPPGSQAYTGPLPGGTAYAAYAPSGRWHLTQGGRPLASQPAFGWAAQYPGVGAGTGQLSFQGTPLGPLGTLAEVLLWLIVAGMLLGRGVWLEWWWAPLRRRRQERRREAGPTVAAPAPAHAGSGASEP